MSDKYFPIFINLSKKKILVVGAGEIASRRVKELVNFGCDITVVAPMAEKTIADLSEKNMIKYIQECYNDEMLVCADIVFLCTDNSELNHDIWEKCKNRGILVNNCSDKFECDFYFPAIVEKEDTVIAINSSGNHKATAETRRMIEEFLNKEK